MKITLIGLLVLLVLVLSTPAPFAGPVIRITIGSPTYCVPRAMPVYYVPYAACSPIYTQQPIVVYPGDYPSYQRTFTSSRRFHRKAPSSYGYRYRGETRLRSSNPVIHHSDMRFGGRRFAR